MTTRNVDLTEQQDRLIAGLIASGRYEDVSEVLREGLRLLEQHEDERTARLDAVRQAIDSADKDLAEGRRDELSNPAAISAWLDEIEMEAGSDRGA